MKNLLGYRPFLADCAILMEFLHGSRHLFPRSAGDNWSFNDGLGIIEDVIFIRITFN